LSDVCRAESTISLATIASIGGVPGVATAPAHVVISFFSGVHLTKIEISRRRRDGELA
jgi:hypothetical protein